MDRRSQTSGLCNPESTQKCALPQCILAHCDTPTSAVKLSAWSPDPDIYLTFERGTCRQNLDPVPPEEQLSTSVYCCLLYSETLSTEPSVDAQRSALAMQP